MRYGAFLLCGFAAMVLAVGPARAEKPDMARDVRQVVLDEAHRKLPDYFKLAFKTPKGGKPLSLHDIDLLTPVPVLHLDRKRMKTRQDVESTLSRRSDLWTVPVATGGHLIAMMEFEIDQFGKPHDISFGSDFLAARVEKGLTLLGWPAFGRWKDLRLVQSHDPDIDILVLMRGSETPQWIRTDGVDGKAFMMDDRAIQGILAR